MDELEALRCVDFDWTLHLDNIWHAPPSHAPELHEFTRNTILSELNGKTRDSTLAPLGRVFVGPAGAGKTHLLSSLRAAAIASDAWFILVDMTDVRDFWETVLLGFLSSLHSPVGNNTYQYELFLSRLLHNEMGLANSTDPLRTLATAARPQLVASCDRTVAVLGKKYRMEMRQHQDALRALLLLNSEDYQISDVGYGWLQGLQLDEDVARIHGLRAPRQEAIEIIRSLSWLMSLTGPTLFAVDQLDAIVIQQHLSSGGGTLSELNEEQLVSLAIIEGLSGGLMGMRDITRKTLTVISCLESTWEILRTKALQSATDRFREILPLKSLHSSAVAEAIVTGRLTRAFTKGDFSPPYPSWPFNPECFTQARRLFPRQLLKLCDQHINRCLRAGQVTELKHFTDATRDATTHSISPEHLQALDSFFSQAQQDAEPRTLLDEESEDDLFCTLLQRLCRLFIRAVQFPDTVDVVVDAEFPGGLSFCLLHARLRIIYHDENDREEHYSFRALQRSNAIAFQSRLKAAMTAAGIDRRLGFRRLLVVRNDAVPEGPVSQEITVAFEKAGGIFVHLSEQEMRTMVALACMEAQDDPYLDAWLQSRQPLQKLTLLRAAGLFGPAAAQEECANLASYRAPAAKIRHEAADTSTDILGETLSATADGADQRATTPMPAPHSDTGILHDTLQQTTQKRDDSFTDRRQQGLGKAAGILSDPLMQTSPGQTSPAQTEPKHIEDSNADHGAINAQQAISEPAPGAQRPSILSDPTPPINTKALFLGTGLVGDQPMEPQYLDPAALSHHGLILAGAGSGGALLLRRLVEEVALLGRSVVVIDTGGMLVNIGEPWPTSPAGMDANGMAKAAAFNRDVDVMLWTPGLSEGKPLDLPLFPKPTVNVGAGFDNLNRMLSDAFLPVAVPDLAKKKCRIFNAVLGILMCRGGGGLGDLIRILNDLPSDASVPVLGSKRGARKIAEQLDHARQAGEIWDDPAHPLDAGTLLGDGQRPCVSVVSLMGLPDPVQRQHFVSRLILGLYNYLLHDGLPDPVRLGLMACDEVRDFAPADRMLPVTANLLQFADLSRDLNFGLLLATGAPGALSPIVPGMCATHFYGKAASPAAIRAIRELMAHHGGAGQDIMHLSSGRFYLYCEGRVAPVKVAMPPCLTRHLDKRLEIPALIALARARHA